MENTQLKSLRILVTVGLALAGLMASITAKASTVEPFDLTLANGAVFSGTLTFATSSLTNLAGVQVNATLTDYSDGTLGYTGTGFDTIDLVDTGVLYTYSLAKIDHIVVTDNPWGTPVRTNENRITLIIDTTTAQPTLILNSLSGVDLIDAAQYQSHFIEPNGSPAFTPEPSSFLLFGSGLIGFAGLIRRRIGLRT
jgi:hypothetical protein